MNSILQRVAIPSCLLILTAFMVSCGDDSSDEPALIITDIQPDAGPVGTIVDIYVENMESPVSSHEVTFNGKKATNIWLGGAGGIGAEVPPLATTGKVTVRVNGKQATSQKTFTVTN